MGDWCYSYKNINELHATRKPLIPEKNSLLLSRVVVVVSINRIMQETQTCHSIRAIKVDLKTWWVSYKEERRAHLEIVGPLAVLDHHETTRKARVGWKDFWFRQEAKNLFGGSQTTHERGQSNLKHKRQLLPTPLSNKMQRFGFFEIKKRLSTWLEKIQRQKQSQPTLNQFHSPSLFQ